MVNRGTPWRKEEAAALWRAGKSGNEIARTLDVTRGMVMGYLNRQGLVGESKEGAAHKALKAKRSPPQKAKPPPKKAKAPPRKAKRPAQEKPNPAPVAAPIAPVSVPVAEKIEEYSRKGGYHLIELEHGQCRFPISDHDVDKDSHLFCGVACSSGKLFCDKHMEKVRRRKTTSTNSKITNGKEHKSIPTAQKAHT